MSCCFPLSRRGPLRHRFRTGRRARNGSSVDFAPAGVTSAPIKHVAVAWDANRVAARALAYNASARGPLPHNRPDSSARDAVSQKGHCRWRLRLKSGAAAHRRAYRYAGPQEDCRGICRRRRWMLGPRCWHWADLAIPESANSSPVKGSCGGLSALEGTTCAVCGREERCGR